LIRRLLQQGVKTIHFTDASRDGTLSGPGVEALREILAQVGKKATFFASGGIGSLEDLRTLKELEPLGLDGVIVGRALYDGKLNLKDALSLCSPKGSSPASTSRQAGSSRESVSST
jgi:phosphoribosylformimino-5-aminoimidazole carboxamide ribotide isomerase